jgi:hypothetical protein
MIEVFPRRIVGAFPDGQYVVVLETANQNFMTMVCNTPYEKMIYGSSKICANGGWLFRCEASGIFKDCLIVDREGVMSFVSMGEKSVYDYGPGLAMHGSLQHGTKLMIEESLVVQDGVKERMDKLEQEVGTLFPLPKLESTSQLKAACEFLRI